MHVEYKKTIQYNTVQWWKNICTYAADNACCSPHCWTEQRWLYHIKRLIISEMFFVGRVCSRGADGAASSYRWRTRESWEGTLHHGKRAMRGWGDFTPWWTCAGPGRTHGCCSQTHCRTCRQTGNRDFMNIWRKYIVCRLRLKRRKKNHSVVGWMSRWIKSN